MAYIGKSPTGTGVRQRYYFTASGGETTLGASADDNGLTLSYSDGLYVDVLLNGVELVAGTDYNTNTTNRISGLAALAANDIVTVTVYDIFTVADTVSAKDGGVFSDNVTFNGNINAGTIKETTGTNTAITIDSGGVVAEPNKEYFHVDLTTEQSGNTDNTTVVVDFGAKGTVKYDTKSNVDTSNDAYLLDSSDGVYLISFSVGIKSNSISDDDLVDAGAYVEVATDGSTFAALHGSGENVQDSNSDERGSSMHSGTFIYKSTTATTKIRVRAHANTSPTVNYTIAHEVQSMIAATQAVSQGSRCTFLSIVRIA